MAVVLGPTYVDFDSDAFKPACPDHALQMARDTTTPVYVIAIASFLAPVRRLAKEDRSMRKVMQ